MIIMIIMTTMTWITTRWRRTSLAAMGTIRSEATRLTSGHEWDDRQVGHEQLNDGR